LPSKAPKNKAAPPAPEYVSAANVSDVNAIKGSAHSR